MHISGTDKKVGMSTSNFAEAFRVQVSVLNLAPYDVRAPSVILQWAYLTLKRRAWKQARLWWVFTPAQVPEPASPSTWPPFPSLPLPALRLQEVFDPADGARRSSQREWPSRAVFWCWLASRIRKVPRRRDSVPAMGADVIWFELSWAPTRDGTGRDQSRTNQTPSEHLNERTFMPPRTGPASRYDDTPSELPQLNVADGEQISEEDVVKDRLLLRN